MCEPQPYFYMTALFCFTVRIVMNFRHCQEVAWSQE
jgi:hypothetical protein